jgi:hypothetical protein
MKVVFSIILGQLVSGKRALAEHGSWPGWPHGFQRAITPSEKAPPPANEDLKFRRL